MNYLKLTYHGTHTIDAIRVKGLKKYNQKFVNYWSCQAVAPGATVAGDRVDLSQG